MSSSICTPTDFGLLESRREETGTQRRPAHTKATGCPDLSVGLKLLEAKVMYAVL